VVEEGLRLLVEHVGILREDVEHLIAAKRPRAALVVDSIAREEAAKVLMLLDLVRLGWDDDERTRALTRAFYHHLARGIYAEIAEARPASYGEVRQMVETARESHYLDGPNDADWIFRNAIEAHREETLYVDYVVGDGESWWSTPARRDELMPWSASPVTRLAVALGRAGVTSAEGLRLVAAEWRGVTLNDKTHWQEVVARSKRILTAVHAAGLAANADVEDMRTIIGSWGFPLHGLDLRSKKVQEADLREAQQRTFERLEREFYGYDESYY
jgi:AbiV family abortive infection protein